MRSHAQAKVETPQPEYFELDGQRLEVKEELRTAAAAVRRNVAEWTGTLPTTVPCEWPSAVHLFQEQANIDCRADGRPPLYQWGGLVLEDSDGDEPEDIYSHAVRTAPPAPKQWDPAVLAKVALLSAGSELRE